MLAADAASAGEAPADAAGPSATRPLTCTLSSTGGEAGPSMQRFVQEHVTSILHPLAEHIKDLQDQTRELAKDLGLTDARVCGYLGKLETQERGISSLRAGQALLGEGIEKLRSELSGALQRHAALERQHTETRGDVGRASRDLKASTQSLGQLQQALREAVAERCTSIHQLQQELSEAKERTGHLQSGFKELDAAHHRLAQAVRVDLQKGLQDTREQAQLNVRSLERLSAAADCQRQDHLALAAELRRRDDGLERDLRAAREALEQAQASSLASARLELGDAAGHMGDIEVSVQSLKEQLESRYSTLEKRLEKLGIAAPANNSPDETDESGLSLIAEVSKSTQQAATDLKQQATYLRHLREADERRSRQLQGLEQRLGSLEDRSHELTNRAGSAEEKLRGCEASQRGVAEQLDVHRLELDRVHEFQQQLNTGLGGAAANLRIVGDQVRTVGQDVARHSARLDVAHELIGGVGRGLQDTHKRVLCGHDGLLPPRGVALTTKGALPTPRGLPKLVQAPVPEAHRGQLG